MAAETVLRLLKRCSKTKAYDMSAEFEIRPTRHRLPIKLYPIRSGEIKMSASKAIDPLWAWGEEGDQPRVLHSMLRVRDVNASLRFYCDGLGMKVLNRYDFEAGRFSILFLSYAGYRDGPAALELTYNWDQNSDYTHGTGYGHLAIGVPDVPAMWQRLVEYGGHQTTVPKPMLEGAPLQAFINDPDGYSIELLQIHRTQA
jgi:lactoylglutathione lyase